MDIGGGEGECVGCRKVRNSRTIDCSLRLQPGKGMGEEGRLGRRGRRFGGSRLSKNGIEPKTQPEDASYPAAGDVKERPLPIG